MTYAVDFGWGRPTALEIITSGAAGVLRYVSSDKTKSISKAEAETYWIGNIPYALVFEDGPMDFTINGRGIEKARIAAPILAEIGFPKSRPVYCAVDGDLSPSLYEVTYQNIHAFCSALGRDDAVYADRPFIYYCHAKHNVKWLWELSSASFNVGPEPVGKRLQQLVGPWTINGTAVDHNAILMVDWGQLPAPSMRAVLLGAIKNVLPKKKAPLVLTPSTTPDPLEELMYLCPDPKNAGAWVLVCAEGWAGISAAELAYWKSIGVPEKAAPPADVFANWTKLR